MCFAHKIRQSIQHALPREVYAEATYDLHAGRIYVPLSHIKALRLETSLVVGGRGVGKSFWTEVLHNEQLRDTLIGQIPELANTTVDVGFSAKECIEKYPTSKVLMSFLQSKYDPETVWTAVLMRWLARIIEEPLPIKTWEDTVEWVLRNPEYEARLLQKVEDKFKKESRHGLIIFDSLDRTSNNWEAMNKISQGLLKVILRLKSTSTLYGKVFFREDQITNTVTNFPDASKLFTTRCDLTWQFHDLHGLLWQMLCNASDDSGVALRGIYKKYDSRLTEREGAYHISNAAMQTAEIQKDLFHTLTGPYMGKDKRRGAPYTWIVSHLADSKRQTSPRSFLAALGEAAEDSLERYEGYDAYPLHYESIKRGVQKASTIRVKEISEDYPWVSQIFECLDRQINVPVETSLLTEKWATAFPNGFTSPDRLPPQNGENGWRGIIQELQRLGLCEVMLRDGRINMPDIYRIAFNIGRKGGVKPVLVNRP